MHESQQYVCPLCCEELDLSDREFYPCKCGYQVCMWCWHRIRESESGLCPACRTPYGEDPHQFSAVDVEEAIKHNKAIAKRDKHHKHDDNDGDHATTDAPKDRTQLANMRVIRRNLVYAVGLPLNIATEEILRRPEYFGQYGKIAKIVLNRSQVTASGDPRRASASAYVTYVHKEDTLACILALDGFYLDNRNIRASYGTSKYCSAFIKGMRCNNPECTYLHEMGSSEDTFTKQEIQAGYVTSGRDVLARQQQIVAEQLKLAGGSGNGSPRKRIGGGGPSGTGRASNHPVFPPPEFEEPSKAPPPAPAPVATVAAAPVSYSRSVSVSANPTPTPATSAVLAAASKPSAARAASMVVSPTSTLGVAMAGANRKATGATVASVVAGVHTVSAKTEDPIKSSLTPLTPLKRATKAAPRAASMVVQAGSNELEKLVPLRNTKKNGTRAMSTSTSTVSSVSSSAPNTPPREASQASIGGDVIGPPIPTRTATVAIEPTLSASVEELGGEPIPLASLGHSNSSSCLGGELFTGHLSSNSQMPVIGAAIGSGKDKWNSTPVPGLQTSTFINGNDNTSLWGAPLAASSATNLAPGPSNTNSIGVSAFGSVGSSPFGGNSSSSALASILGINLPTGSGSLHETTSLWSAAPQPPTPLSSLNGSALPLSGGIGGLSNGSDHGSSLIGGIPIGGTPLGPRGGSAANTAKSDIALLQSLLPGVHITSGNDPLCFGGIGGSGWGMAPGSTQGLGGSMYRSDGLSNDWGGASAIGNGGSGNNNGSSSNNNNNNNKAVGAVGQNSQRRGPDIW
jgi:CCR4-NOT transcription complex subunit 4